MKKQYEVEILRQVEGSIKGDFETFDYAGCGCDYRQCVKIAKEKSTECDACNIVCYTSTEDTEYEIVFKERYANGMKEWRKVWD